VKHVRKRLTYANVMSSIAVFLVLGGATAFAASSLGKNTVGSKQIKKNAVTTAKIKNGAVTGAKVNVSTLGKVPSATTADTAKTATSADTAKTADSAKTATSANSANTATNAENANALGGKAASEYSVRYFARVTGAASPTLEAGSPGVTVDPTRPFTGAARVEFPVDMTNCAIVATAFNGGVPLFIRQSSIGTGKVVAIVAEPKEGATTNQAFNVVGIC